MRAAGWPLNQFYEGCGSDCSARAEGTAVVRYRGCSGSTSRRTSLRYPEAKIFIAKSSRDIEQVPTPAIFQFCNWPILLKNSQFRRFRRLGGNVAQ